MTTNRNTRPRFAPRSRQKEGGRKIAAISRQNQRTTPNPKVSRVIKGDEEPLRFAALGGLEEIGRNMLFFEYKDEIVIFDAGLQFPEVETPGIDFIIPNVQYLEERKWNIKGIIITHGHYDHIGAIPYIMDKLGNPPMYATNLTKEIIKKRQEDYPHAPKPVFQTVKDGETHRLGQYFSMKLFGAFHNIPEGIGIILETPVGKVVHPGEFKFDYDDKGNPKGLDKWKEVGKEGIHTLLLDSTGSEVPGYSLSERIVEREIEKLIKNAPGRVILSTFASLLDRIGEAVKISERLGKKVAISGYSMKNNLQITQRLGYLKFHNDTLINLEDIGKYPDNKIVILSTGAQGESSASLVRIANGEHRQIKIKKNDTVILSSSVVPGNEKSVQSMKDNLARQGALVYHHKMLDIHSSGHAPQEELKTVMGLVKPKFFIPIHGYYFMRWRNIQLAQEAIKLPPEKSALVDNGVVVNLYKDSIETTREKLPSQYIMIDGSGVGDVGEVVLRDRRILSQEGMLVVIAIVSRENGRVLKNPDIISRGFIYLKENQELLSEIRKKIRYIIGKMEGGMDIDYAKNVIRDQISEFLFKKTKRRPMVLPVVIEV